MRTFVTRSYRRVIEHCDALLVQPLSDDERSRLIALRDEAEAQSRDFPEKRQFDS